MPAEEKWFHIDHVLVVTPDGPSPEEGDVAFRFTGAHGPLCKPIACYDCGGTGWKTDENDQEQHHDECAGTGAVKGTCWVLEGDTDWREALGENHEDWWLPGRWFVEYRVLDWDIDAFHIEARRAGPAPNPFSRGARSLTFPATTDAQEG